MAKWSFGQLFVPTYSNAFIKEFVFNASYLRSNQIKKIIFEIIDKKDYQIAVNKNLTEYYEFNADGLLSKFYYTDIVRTVEKQVTVPAIYKGKRKVRGAHTETFNQYVYDTIGSTFVYTGFGKLLMKRYHDGNGYYESRFYSYDSLNQLIKECRYKETNANENRTDFILGNQVLMSTDSMKWINYSPQQSKLIYYNNENRPYKEQVYLSKDSLVREINENYVSASWIQQNQLFDYNEKKQLTSATFRTNASTTIEYKYNYEYDEQGWLLTAKYYKNNVLLTEASYVNDHKSKLVNSIVIRDHPNKSIRIIKLKYAFFDTIQVKNR